MLNSVYAAGLPGSVPVHPQQSRSLQYARALFYHSLVRLAGASYFPNLFSEVSSPCLFHFSLKISLAFSVNCILSNGISF